jgi:hypothetical protein
MDQVVRLMPAPAGPVMRVPVGLSTMVREGQRTGDPAARFTMDREALRTEVPVVRPTMVREDRATTDQEAPAILDREALAGFVRQFVSSVA